MTNKNSDYIRSAGLGVPLGSSTRDCICPKCGTKAGNFSITRTQEGLLYHCFRASCGLSGIISSRHAHNEEHRGKEKIKIEKKRDYIYSLDIEPCRKCKDVTQYMENKYNIKPGYLDDFGCGYCSGTGDFVVPIRGYDVFQVSCIMGYWFKDLQYILTGKLPSHKRTKTKLYWVSESQKSKLYAPYTLRCGIPTIIVEDPLSAIRLVTHMGTDYNIVALLGSHMNQEQAQVLAQYSSILYLMLDPDTWESGAIYKPMDNFKLMFDKIMPILSLADPKDLSDEDIKGLKSTLSGELTYESGRS